MNALFRKVAASAMICALLLTTSFSGLSFADIPSSIVKKGFLLGENSSKTSAKQKNYVEGEVLVKYKKSKINLETVSGRTAANNLITSKSMESKEDLRSSNISVLKIRDASTVEQKIATLKNDPNVESAQPNFQYYPTTINSNDSSRGELWGLDNLGQSVRGISGTIDADIDAPEAWALNEGTNGTVIVAVIDSGVAYNHPDLLGNMWNGSSCVSDTGAALGGCNYGYDFEDSDKTPLPTTSSHGTHVAGTIAAIKNNSKGSVGVAPNAKIMAIKSSLTTVDNVKSINFARYNGAKVINASWGGSSYDQLLKDVIESFPGVFVAAAGNENTNNENSRSYPSDYTSVNIISVAATDQNDALASFSNYGATSVDVGAPGTNIYSTVSSESIVLNETFEDVILSGVPNLWIKGGTNNWGVINSGNQGWNNVLYGDLTPSYSQSANSTITSPAYNISNVGASMDFWTVCDTEYNPSYWTDYMSLEVSSDNFSTFITLLKWDESFIDSDSDSTGSAIYHFEGISIPERFSTSNFKFRLRWFANGNSDVGSAGDGCAVDDIKITKLSNGSDEQYDYYQGTSMAAPHVAGLAALLAGYNTSLTSAQVKDIILTSGDSVASLSGKTVSGKRINAHKSLLAANPAKAITGFNFTSPAITGTIDEATKTIALIVPFGTNVSALVPTFTTTGASVSVGGIAQVSGTTAHDFTLPVTYIVTAGDDSTQSYIVTVTVMPNTEANILSFNSTAPSSTGIITGNNITLTVPFGTSLADLPIAITLSSGATVLPLSGNHTFIDGEPVDYVVTAQDNSTKKTYSVTVIVAANISKDILAFTLASSNGIISDNAIAVTVPYETNVTALIPTITLSGGTINPAADVARDFTNPVVYTVTSSDSSTKEYTVTVTVAANPAKAITEFGFNALDPVVTGIVNEEGKTISLTVPFGTDITALISIFTITGVTVKNGDVLQESGVTPNNFTSPVTYTVTAADGLTQNYIVTVTISPDPDIALVSADKEALIDSSIIGVNNPDLSRITTALTDPLPAVGSVNGSVITWASSDTAIVSNNGQTITRPAYALGDATIILTATLAKGSVTDTKAFTLIVTKLPNTLASITSFGFATPDVGSTVSDTDHTISIFVPNNTDITSLTPTIILSDDATIAPNSGIAQDFSSPVIYTVTAADGETVQTYIVTVTEVSSTQTVPNANGVVTINTATPEVVVTSPTQPIAVTVTNGTTGATVNFGAFITLGLGTLPATTIGTASAQVAIPSMTSVTSADTSWNGVMQTPVVVTTVTLPVESGQTKTLSTAVEMGFSGAKLSFDKGVWILLPGQAGKRAGYVQTGGTFTEITSTCGADDQTTGNALPADGECKITVGSDLVIWTKHFTTFATYSQTTTSSGGGGGGGGGSVTPVVTPIESVVVSPKTQTTPPVNDDKILSDSTGSVVLPSFTDISTSFAIDDIELMVKNGIIKGYDDGTFRPENPITRAEFLSVTMKSLGIDIGTATTTSFTDIPTDGSWMIPYLEQAKILGIANGQTIKGVLKFRPNDAISRGEAVTILLNAAKISVDMSVKTTTFMDIPTASEWMIPYITKAQSLDIINGQIIDGVLKFRPNDSITRAESVKVITKATVIK